MNTDSAFLSAQGYEELELLGRGGMGTVHLVREISSGAQYALKTLELNVAQNPERAEQRFRNEFELLSSLAHPGIVRAYRLLAEEDIRLHMLLEYCRGTPLSDLCGSPKGGEPLAEKLPILLTLAETLAYLHTQGIIHRDVTPGNVLCSTPETSVQSAAEAGPRIKLIDFGIACRVGSAEFFSDNQAGTLPYRSPEQIRNEPPDPRSDIYSFGVLAYELLTGKRPYEAEDILSMNANHLIAPTPLLSESLPGAPLWLEGLLLTCLERRKENRYESFAQVAELLKAGQERRGFLSLLLGLRQ
jgi:serine/threonine-protein kinase